MIIATCMNALLIIIDSAVNVSYNLADGDLPQDPIGPPIMHHNQNIDRVGQFFVNFSTASPPTNDRTFNQSSIAPVAFLFRIKLMSTHAVSFIWVVSYYIVTD